MRPGDWVDHAACRDDARDWIDVHAGQVAAMVQLCTTCPVRSQCAEVAATIRAHGVWAGQLLREGKPRPLPHGAT